jgi:hypothetical protein
MSLPQVYKPPTGRPSPSSTSPCDWQTGIGDIGGIAEILVIGIAATAKSGVAPRARRPSNAPRILRRLDTNAWVIERRCWHRQPKAAPQNRTPGRSSNFQALRERSPPIWRRWRYTMETPATFGRWRGDHAVAEAMATVAQGRHGATLGFRASFLLLSPWREVPRTQDRSGPRQSPQRKLQ